MSTKSNPNVFFKNIALAKSAETAMECDVIIVNYNAGKLLFDAVSSSFEAGATKVIVVDNASTDDSIDYLQRSISSHGLLIINNSQNFGFSKACNIGIKASSARQVLFLNPDCVIAKDSLRIMTHVLESATDIGMVGGFLVNPDGSEQPGGRRVFPTPKRAFMRAFGFSRFSKFLPKAFSDFLLHLEPLPTGPTVVEAISGACMLVKRESIETVGLWDDEYFLHCEDLDWCMRFKLAGLKIMFVPNAKITHVWGACSRSRPFFVAWHKHKGMLRFYKKFFRKKHTALLWWLVVLGVWIRFSLFVIYHSAKSIFNTASVKRE
ncbi:glycosyltransferase family 2 protein [Pseudomonas sp. BNK-45]|uniref:glycosyltransferase family 2 protein n=1 Tax=Pseudomonas sp. BNK-45 TaxID=3376180 RepID=UPI0039BF5E65